MLLDVDHLANIDQVGILDVRVQPQKAVDGRSKLVGDDPERIASLYNIGHDAGRDAECLSSIDDIRIADLRIDPQDGIHSGAEFGCDLTQGVAFLNIIDLPAGRRRLVSGGGAETYTFSCWPS